MPIYTQKDVTGAIIAWAKQPEDGFEELDFDGELVRGLDDRFYLPGKEPRPSIAGVQATKRAEINAGFDAAMTASLTMPSASPNAFSVYQAIELWKTEDPEGFNALLAIHTARRTSLLAAVDAATTVEAVHAITVSYAV